MLSRSIRFPEGSRRFLPPILAVLAAKILLVYWMFVRFGGWTGDIHTRWLRSYAVLFPTRFNFLALFTEFDSGWYLSIARDWYSGTRWFSDIEWFWPGWAKFSFFPAYPATIRLGFLFTGDYLLSAVVPVFLFGLAWIPFFQAIAERYMSRIEAMNCTIFTAFFPSVLFFSSVAYSEPMFIFATVASWYFNLKDRVTPSTVFATLATLTRSYGILAVLPILADTVTKRKWRNLVIVSVPAAALLAWWAYSANLSGNLWILFTAHKYWNEVPWYSGWLLPFLSGKDVGFDIAFFGLVAFFIYLVFATAEVDWRLSLYSIPVLAITLLMVDMSSYVRILSFAFPIWLAFQTKRTYLLLPIVVLFLLFTAMTWYQFIIMRFVA
jgi:hypothetical protein